MQTLNNLVAKKVLRFRPNSDGREYSLARPLKINFSYSIINQLKAIYKPDREKGGIFEFIAVQSELVCVKFHEIPNGAVNSTSYNPNKIQFDKTVDEILLRGNLPMAVHTHPTAIGLHSYDTKNAKFYLKSSRPDRLIADQTIDDNLVMPEAIFVKDERFGTGYGLAIYEGGIFPYAISAISDTQIVVAGAAGILLALNKLSRNALYLIAGVFTVEFFRRPKYEYDAQGNLKVSISI